MGAEYYYYFVKYHTNPAAVLHELRQREFLAGRYNPVIAFPKFPVNLTTAPGAGHRSIQEAIVAAEADGTRSILDLDTVADEPRFGAVTPLSHEALEDIFGATAPIHEIVEHNLWKLFNLLDRGHGAYVIVYRDGQPDEILFAGLSAD
jgi:hypothetical protein